MPLYEIEPYWRSGTASIENGSKALTGVGTDWLANVEPGDQFFGADGRMEVVDTVNSDTSITLLDNWPGATQVAGKYKVYRVPDSVRLENFNQRMVNLLKGGVLSSIGGLDGTGGDKLLKLIGPGAAEAITAKVLLALNGLDGTGGDKGIVLTGAGTAETYALTPAFRQLADDPDFATMRQTLAVTLENISLTSKQSDAPLGVRRAGNAMEFGHPSPAGFGSVLGAEVQSGLSFIALNAEAGSLNNTYRTRGYRGSIIRGDLSGGIDFLTIPLASADNQSPSLLAKIDGAGSFWIGGQKLVASGSNANGSWLRFADGTQICWSPAILISVAENTLLTDAPSRSWPAAFSADPTPLATPISNYSNNVAGAAFNGYGAANYTVRAINVGGAVNTAGTCAINVLGIGKWAA